MVKPFCTDMRSFPRLQEPVKNVLSDEEVAPLFDNVSMQFCIHYAFSDVGRVRLMLENASRYLRKGGVFFGTTLSDHKIM